MKIRFLILTMLLIGAFGCRGTLDAEEFAADESYEADSGVPTAPTTTTPSTNTPTTPTATPDAGMPPDVSVGSADTGGDAESEPDMGMPDMRPEPGSIVEFRITEGTGTGAWNTREEAVVVYVGQILRIINEDSRDHQLHAGDNAPVDHGNRLVPGQSQDLEVERPMELGDNPQLYDHNDGRDAAFWIESRE